MKTLKGQLILVAVLLLSAFSCHAKEARKQFLAPCSTVYARAVELAHAKYHGVTPSADGHTLEMDTGNRWKDGELTIRVDFSEGTANSCSVHASSLSRGPAFNDPKTFLDRLSKEAQ